MTDPILARTRGPAKNVYRAQMKTARVWANRCALHIDDDETGKATHVHLDNDAAVIELAAALVGTIPGALMTEELLDAWVTLRNAAKAAKDA